MKELFLETKLKFDELNRKVKGFKHISNLKTADAFTLVANNTEPGLETPLLDTKTKPNSTKKKEKAKTKESSAENSDDSFSKNSQTTILTNQERKSIALSLEYTQDELDHITRAWASHNQRAKKAWKLARKYSGRAFKRKYFEIYDYIDIEVEVEAPDPSNYDAYRTRICAMIEAATAKANIPNNLLMNSKAKDTLRNYGTRLEAIVDYLDNFYDADIRLVATLIEIALHMSCRGALYTDTKCLALIKYASSFLKLSVTDDEFLEKLLYFVEHLFEVLKNKMPLMAYSDKDCLKSGIKTKDKCDFSSSLFLTTTNLIVAECRCFNKILLDDNNESMNINLLRYSYLSDLKELSEKTQTYKNIVEFGAFNQGIRKCLRNFDFYNLMLNKAFTSMKPLASSAHKREHDDRVDKKFSVEFEMFMRMINRLKRVALILFIRRLQKDHYDLEVMVELLAKNPFAPKLSRRFGSPSKLNNDIQAVNKKKIELPSAKEFYNDLSREPNYKLLETFENTRNNMAKSIKNVYPRSFFVAECEKTIEKLKVPKIVYGTKNFGVYMKKFLQNYEKYS